MLGIVEGFAGYSLPDDLLSGTGLRIADAIMLSIPVIGTWVSFLVFGGPFPGTAIIGRLYIAHVLLIPAILLALIGGAPGPARAAEAHPVPRRRTRPRPRSAASGSSRSTRPRPAASSSSSSACCAALGGLAQINPIWLFGPYNPAQVSAGSQPDWYMAFLDGSTRLFPSWEITAVGPYTVPPLFWPTVVLPGILITLAAAYPFIEAKMTKDRATHHLLQRPRDVPVRTALGAMAIDVLHRAVHLRRQRPHRQGVRHLAERDDVGRPHRAARPAADRLRGRPTGSASACSATTARCSSTASRPASSSGCRPVSSSRCTSRSARSTSTVTASSATPAAPVPKRMNQLGTGALRHVRGFFCPVVEKPEIAEKLAELEEAEETAEAAERRHQLTD